MGRAMPKTARAKKDKVAETKIPEWVTDHFTAALDAHDKLIQVARLSAGGISMHRGRPQAIRVLAKTRGHEDEDETSKLLEQAELDAALAEREVAEGFPVLHGLMAIAIWSWLENFTKGFVELWFLKRPAAIKAAPIQRLKVRLGDYLLLSRREQAQFLVELLEQDLSSPMKQGVTRFNSLLDAIGLSISLPDETTKLIFELHKVRNNLAHRNGTVDATLRNACPWMNFKLGQPLRVTRSMLMNYSNATATVLVELLYRVGDEYGADLRENSEAHTSADEKPRD